MTLTRLVTKLAALAALFAWLPGAQASPVLWTLTDVLFADGGVATGSFVYDAATDTYSNVSITTTDSGLVPNATYTAVVFGTDYDAALVPSAMPDLTGAALFQLIYQFPLTDAGGLVLLYDPFFPAYSSFDGSCLNAGCTSIDYDRLVVDGGIIGEAYVPTVPVPAAGILLVSALGLMAGVKRMRAG
jgi:hypothetical protein